jgi:hypothetical protein
MARDWALLAGRSPDGTSRATRRSLLCIGPTRRLHGKVAGLFFGVTAAAIFVAMTFAVSESRVPVGGHTSTAPSAVDFARPDRSNDPAADLIAKPAPQDTDPQGFLGYPDARCNAANPVVAIGRTSTSLIVICQNYAGRFYYKGFGLNDGRSVEVDNLLRAEDKFSTTRNDVRYFVSSAALIVKRGSNTFVDEPMLEYWSV